MSFVSGVAATTTLVLQAHGPDRRADRAPGADPKLRRTMLRLASYRAGGRLAF